MASKNVPVLRDTHRDPLVVMPPDHVSNSFSNDLVNRFGTLTPDAPLLFLGAGATTTRIPHSVEVEFNQFIHTDIIADAHRLPFEDNTFGGCLCLNTFEHLSDPIMAAAEIYRVLMPGTRVVVHTAFIQPLHEAPHHYFNATKFGVLQWFKNFDIEHCIVSSNFQCQYPIAWIASMLLNLAERFLSPDQVDRLRYTTIEEMALAWDHRGGVMPPWWHLVSSLPNDAHEFMAGGLEISATKHLAFSR